MRSRSKYQRKDAKPSDKGAWVIFSLVFASGFAGLAYQVLWMKQIGLLFGSTSQATAVTLAAFFAGLGAGSWWWGRRVATIARPLRCYAWLEFGIALSALTYFGVLKLFHVIYGLGSTDAYLEQTYQASIPLHLFPETESIFFLGLGTGISAGAALNERFPNVRRVLSAELIPEVVEAAKKWIPAEMTGGVFDDPRSTIRIEDGRHLLRASDDRFDMINADLFLPYRRGAGSLYSLEHFRVAAESMPFLYAGNLTASADLFHDFPVNTDDRPLIEYQTPITFRKVAENDNIIWCVGPRLTAWIDRLLAASPPEEDPLWAGHPDTSKHLVRAGASFHRTMVDKALVNTEKLDAEWEQFRMALT